jgi:two-component system cell cycle sensor histidine kinase/response regulator CckA
MLAYAGLGNQHVEPADLNRLVLETCDSVRGSVRRQIRIDAITANDMVLLTTDTQRMRQVIADLVMNAAEAIRDGVPGTITVRSETTVVPPGESLSPGPYAVLEVHDNGCGMDAETLKKIFDPFFSTKFLGRGLGLAAVHGFVRSNGGDVQVESSPGIGTIFRILLPAAGNRVRSEGATV